MSWRRLVWRNLQRHPLRSVLTSLSVALSIFIVCAVLSLPAALTAILERATSNTRIAIHHRAGLTYPLPASYVPRVRDVPGVVAVNHYTWFGGLYDEPKNFFPNFAIEPDTLSEVWADCMIDPQALRRFQTRRQGALVGEQTMRKFGWRVGQNVTLRSPIFRVSLTFEIVGELPASTCNPVIMWFQYKYLEEALQPSPGSPFQGFPYVGMIWATVDRPEHIARIMRDIDALFQNSDAETATDSEKTFLTDLMSSYESFARIIVGVSALVVLAVLLIAANTSAMSVRERIPEIAILKSLGFKRGRILMMLLAESVLQGAVGGTLGVSLAFVVFQALAAAGQNGGVGPLLGPLASFSVDRTVVAQGLATALGVGALAGLLPAWKGAQLSIVAGLRQLG